jgi:SAM-dependent methyltransferase
MLATENAAQRGVGGLTDFRVMDYCRTDFPDGSFDVVWACESVCYADDKALFIREAYRLLKPGGRLVLADGFVTRFENNADSTIRQWLKGWQVNYLESAERMTMFMRETGFSAVQFRDITREVFPSSRRLYRIYFLASLYLRWRKWVFSRRATELQKGNITACKCQYHGLKKGLWQYGLLTATRK